MVALPAATPASLTPCSTPHIHAGRDPRNRMSSPSWGSISRYVVRPGSRSGLEPFEQLHFGGGRSEFFANNVWPSRSRGRRDEAVTHRREGYVAAASGRNRMGSIPQAVGP